MVNVEILRQIQQKTNKSDEQLKKELEEIYNSLDKSLPDEMRKTVAFNRMVSQYRKVFSPYQKAEIFECIFIGSNDKRDMVASQREQAIEFYKANPTEAVKLKIADEKGNPLYYATKEEYEKLPQFRRELLGTKLPDTQFQRYAIGKARVGESLVDLEFKIRGDNCDKEIPTFTPIKINALKLTKSTEEKLYLNDSGELNIEVVGEKLSEDAAKKLLESFKDRFITISQIDEFVSSHPEFLRYCIMNVTVADIVPSPTKTGSQVIRIQDDSIEFIDKDNNPIPPTVCWIPKFMEIDFPLYSDVYLIGIPNVSERGKSINAMGIYVPEMFKKLKVVPLNPDESDLEIEDWK